MCVCAVQISEALQAIKALKVFFFFLIIEFLRVKSCHISPHYQSSLTWELSFHASVVAFFFSVSQSRCWVYVTCGYSAIVFDLLNMSQPWMKVFYTLLMQQFETPTVDNPLRDFWLSFCSCYLIKSLLFVWFNIYHLLCCINGISLLIEPNTSHQCV